MSRLQLRPTFSLLLLAGLCAAPAAAAPPVSSWGKAGVSFADYRADAVSCLREAAATDLSGSAPARALILASRRIRMSQQVDFTPMINGAGGLDPMSGRNSFDPTDEATVQVSQAQAAGRLDQRLHEARGILEARLASCLVGRGYRRFHLTGEQSRALAHLPARAPERQAYLHRLASDPGVLAAQSD